MSIINVSWALNRVEMSFYGSRLELGRFSCHTGLIHAAVRVGPRTNRHAFDNWNKVCRFRRTLPAKAIATLITLTLKTFVLRHLFANAV